MFVTFESQRSDRNEKYFVSLLKKKLDLTELKVFERNLIFLSGWKKGEKTGGLCYKFITIVNEDCKISIINNTCGYKYGLLECN